MKKMKENEFPVLKISNVEWDEDHEELEKLRADTSIKKTILSKTLPNAKDMMPNIEIMRKEN